MKLRVFESFAGIGGGSFALKRISEKYSDFEYELVGYSEVDKFAIKIFNANHNKQDKIINYGDITSIDPNTLPDFDLFMGGFPCQPFSVAGLMQGVNDTRGRGTMLSHIVRILNVKKPKYILLENVKGFLSEKFKDTREALAEMLKEIGYSTFEDASFVCTLLNTKDYGIPQNRERVWIFASLEKLPNDFGLIPYPTIASGKVCNFLDPVETIDESNFLSVEQVNKLKERLGISSFKVTEPLCLDVYNKKIKTDGTCPTLTDPSHCNIRVLECRRGEEEVRKLTISEQFRLMGFRDGEVDFANLSYSQLGKRMGNGWDVNVVTLILENIFKQLNIVK
mgnify:CR=1 FL=1